MALSDKETALAYPRSALSGRAAGGIEDAQGIFQFRLALCGREEASAAGQRIDAPLHARGVQPAHGRAIARHDIGPGRLAMKRICRREPVFSAMAGSPKPKVGFPAICFCFTSNRGPMRRRAYTGKDPKETSMPFS